jgi:hypothetical protein
MKALYSALAAVTLLAAPACRQQYTSGAEAPSASERRTDGWNKIGQTTVDGRAAADQDTIPVQSGEREIGALIVRVNKAPVDLRTITVTYTDGRTYTPHLRHTMEQGSRSYEMYLPKDRGPVRSVSVEYANFPGEEEAEVEVWAR